MQIDRLSQTVYDMIEPGRVYTFHGQRLLVVEKLGMTTPGQFSVVGEPA